MPVKTQELKSEIANVKWPMVDPDSRFAIGRLVDGTLFKADAPRGGLVPGIPYQLFGKWGEYQGCPQFQIRQYKREQPNSRHGIINYLIKYASGVGPSLAAKMFDKYGVQAIATLRTHPEKVAEEFKGLTTENAIRASKDLLTDAAMEDTRIKLGELFEGRGFPKATAETCIKKWGIFAPDLIKRDPFKLMVERIPGCGFQRCDRLYSDLGLPANRLKRQTLAAWYAIRTASDSKGHTWHPLKWVAEKIGTLCIGSNPKRALMLGIRAGWISRRRDVDGLWWIAESGKAAAEWVIAAKVMG